MFSNLKLKLEEEKKLKLLKKEMPFLNITLTLFLTVFIIQMNSQEYDSDMRDVKTIQPSISLNKVGLSNLIANRPGNTFVKNLMGLAHMRHKEIATLNTKSRQRHMHWRQGR